MNQSYNDRDAPASTSTETPRAPQPARIAMPESAPYVTYSIIGITVLAYFVQATPYGNRFIEAFIKSNDLIREGQIWRLITPALLHGNLMHIAFNMYALLSFGTGLERHFGHGRFFLLYMLSAFAGNVMSFLMTSADSLGASTAVFGLLGAEGIFLYQNRRLFAGQFGRAIQNVIFIAAINLFLGLQPGIDNWGHIGGLIGGLMFTWFAGPLWEIEGIAPALHLEDQRPAREILVGAATVILVFGALAMWGMVK